MSLASLLSSRAVRRSLGLVTAAALAAAMHPAPAAALELKRLEFLQQSVKTSRQSFVTGFGLRAHLGGGELDDGFEFVPAIENWAKVSRLPELGVPELRQRDWRIGGDVRYYFGARTGWTPYAGAGLALDLVHNFVEVGPQYGPTETRENSGRKLAPNFLAGVDLPATGPIRSSFELSYHLVPDLKQFKINFGFGYEFGKHASAGE
ncbi:MAG: hypothetical protein ABI960_02770 [Candidatus Eisenbacteria bacterium]